MTTTATAAWLQLHHSAEVAYVLWIDGLAIGFTTHDDVDGLSEAWLEATGGAWGVSGDLSAGLKLDGSIERAIEPFVAKIDPSMLTFSIQDLDDRLTRMIFGVARTSIRSTLLTQTVNADATTINVADASALPGLPVVYVGLETMGTTDVDYDANTFAVNRGQWSIFPKVGTYQWARTHEVDPDALDDAPEVTDEPTEWLNRPVGLYVCHRQGGVWSAGFPGTTSNDAELLWAGRIKHWREVEGWIQLECLEITEQLHTTIGTRLYEGTLTEGLLWEEVDAEIQIDMGIVLLGGTATGYSRYVGQLSGFDARVTHEDVASAINSTLTTALTGANDGVYAPSGVTAEFELGTGPDGSPLYRLVWTWPSAGASDIIEPRLYLSPIIWRLLGFKNESRSRTEAQLSVGGWVERVTAHRTGTTTCIVVAGEAPKRFMVKWFTDTVANQLIEVTPTGSDAFVIQEFIPTGFTANVDGFLMLDERRVFAVVQVTDNTFAVQTEVTSQLGLEPGDVGFYQVSADVLEFMDVPDNGGPAIKARQVWIEPHTVGGAMLRVLSSTGTSGYNVPLYDRLPIGMGVAFPAQLMDVSSILNMSALPYLLVVLKPTPFAKLFQSILNVIGKHAVWKDGQLAIVDPIAEVSTPGTGSPTTITLREGNKARLLADDGSDFDQPVEEFTTCETNPESVINRISLRYGLSLDGSFTREVTVHAKRSQSVYGEAKGAVLDGHGVYESGAAYWLANVASAQVAYFSEPVAVCERSIDHMVWTRLYPGARVEVYDDAMIDPRTGERGIVEGETTPIVAWVLSVSMDPMTGVGRVAFVFQPRSVT